MLLPKLKSSFAPVDVAKHKSQTLAPGEKLVLPNKSVKLNLQAFKKQLTKLQEENESSAENS